MRVTVFLATVALFPVVAPTLTSAQTDADTREVLAYRLTMPKLRQLNQAFDDFNRQREADPTYRALLAKKKELAALREKEELSEAEEERMYQLEVEIDEAEADDALEDESLAGMAERIASDPIMAGVVQRASLTPRETAVLVFAFFQAAVIGEMIEGGTISDIPDGVSVENVRFYQANREEISKLTALKERQGEQGN